jgi:hypothetical protein
MGTARCGTGRPAIDLETILQAGLARRTLEIKRNRLRGDWEAFRPGARRPLLCRESRKTAIEAASEHLRTKGVGQIVVLNHTGKVVETKLVWPAELTQPAVFGYRGEYR